MKFLQGVLAFIRNINLTSIVKKYLRSLGGVMGWVASVVGGAIFKGIEKMVDDAFKRGEENMQTKMNDKIIEEKAKENAAKIEAAKTDDEFDDAIRDSLGKR